jgi:predicted RNA binding protein with dsRBD fold (UPF0201 family)
MCYCGNDESLGFCYSGVCKDARAALEKMTAPAHPTPSEDLEAVRKAILGIIERHYLEVPDRTYTTTQAVEDVLSLLATPGGVDAKILLDTAKFWIEKGDKEGASQWRFGLVKLAAKALDKMKGSPEITTEGAPAKKEGDTRD